MSKSSEIYTKNLHSYLEEVEIDKKKIAKRIARLNNSDLQLIKTDYQTFFEKDLVEEFKKKLSENSENTINFLDFILALFEDPFNYDAHELNKVIINKEKNIDNNEVEKLIEIIVPKPNWVKDEIKKVYKQKYGKEFTEDLNTYVHKQKDIFNILYSILNSNRNENDEPKEETCLQEANNLKNINGDSWNNEDNSFYKILCNNSPQEISKIVQKYYELTKKTLLETMEETIKKQKGEKYFDLLKSILFAIISPSEYFARKIKKAITSKPIDQSTLIRIIVSRYELDIQEIKDYYQQIFKSELIQDIKGLDDDFMYLLEELIRN